MPSPDANGFVRAMEQFVDVVEREQVVFPVEIKDPTAPVDFYINGKKVGNAFSFSESIIIYD